VPTLPSKDARAIAHRTRVDVLRVRLSNYPKDANRAYNILCGKSLSISNLEKHRDALSAKLEQRRKQYLIIEDEIRVMSIEMLVTDIRVHEKLEALADKKAKTESIAELRLRQQLEMEALKAAQVVKAPPPKYNDSDAEVCVCMSSFCFIIILFMCFFLHGFLVRTEKIWRRLSKPTMRNWNTPDRLNKRLNKPCAITMLWTAMTPSWRSASPR